MKVSRMPSRKVFKGWRKMRGREKERERKERRRWRKREGRDGARGRLRRDGGIV